MMFGWLKKDPVANLQARYLALLKEARDLQRAGKIPEFAHKTKEAEDVLTELEALKAQRSAT